MAMHKNLTTETEEICNSIATQNDTLPYLAIFGVTKGFSLPESFSQTKYSGLLCCHVTRSSCESKLLTYWRDREYFDASTDSVQQQLSLNVPETTGYVTDVRRPTENLWKRLKLGTMLLSLAAIFGALSALQDYFGRIFASPEVVLAQADTGKLEVVEGLPFGVTFNVVSEVRSAPSKVALSATIQSQTGTVVSNLAVAPSVIANLGAGQSAAIKITGIAPNHSRASGAPDVYRIISDCPRWDSQHRLYTIPTPNRGKPRRVGVDQ